MFDKFLISVILVATFISSQAQSDPDRYNIERLQVKGKEALQFCKSRSLNTDFCVLVDMSIHSGLNRFFIWDLKQQSILDSGLCSHGCCDRVWGSYLTKDNPRFSNTPESHCSSLGKYKIGSRGYSQWGIKVHYKLHGLDSTNSNALARQIVLHSWNDVSEKEVFPKGTPEGWGCPAISNNVMKRLDRRLKKHIKPTILWIFKKEN